MLKLKPVAPNEGVVLAALVTPKPVKELVVELEKEEAAAELAGTDIEGAVEAEDGVKPNEGTENEGCDVVVVVVVVVVVEAAGVEAVVVVIVENNGAAAELGFAADVVETEAAEEGVRNEKGDVVVAVDGDGVGFEKAEAVENESTEEDAVEFGANENEGAVVEAEEEEEEPAKRFEEAERNGDEVELAVDSDVANGDRDGVDPNRGAVEVEVAAVVEDPKRGEAAEGVVVADGVVPKRGEVVAVAVEAVRNGDGEVVDAAGGVEAELKGKEKEGVEDPNPREAGGAEEIGFAAVVVVVEEEEAKEKGEGEDPNGEVEDPNGEAEDPNEKAEAVAVVEKEKGEGVDCEEVVVVAETEDPNGKPDMVSLSLTHSLLLWFWASDFGFGVLKK